MVGFNKRFIRNYFKKHPVFRVVSYLVLLWIVGSLAMWWAEGGSGGFRSLPQASWNLLVYLTSGFEGDQPLTPLGKALGVIVVLLGLALVGWFTATIASVFVEKTLRKGQGMERIKITEHVVICGWNEKTEKIIRELHAPVIKKNRRPIVVINREGDSIFMDDGDPAFDDVFFVAGDPTNERVLRRANIADAYAAVVLADRRRPDTADAQSILIALAIESMNARVHTLVEVINSENLKHFSHTRVDECISMDHLGELLLSQAALNHGISEFFTELLTFQENGNEVYQVDVPPDFIGKPFSRLSTAVMPLNMILVGLKQDGKNHGQSAS